jgi:hypothetical protein
MCFIPTNEYFVNTLSMYTFYKTQVFHKWINFSKVLQQFCLHILLYVIMEPWKLMFSHKISYPRISSWFEY